MQKVTAFFLATIVVATGSMTSVAQAAVATKSNTGNGDVQATPLKITTEVIGEGGRITPLTTSVPKGQERTFKIHLDNGAKLVSVTGCAGTLTDLDYKITPTEECAIIVKFDADKKSDREKSERKVAIMEVSEPAVIPVANVQHEYLSGFATSFNVMCQFSKWVSPYSVTVKQLSGIPVEIVPRPGSLLYTIKLPSVSAGEERLVFQCESRNAKTGEFLTSNTMAMNVFANPVKTTELATVAGPVSYNGSQYAYSITNGVPSASVNGQTPAPLTINMNGVKVYEWHQIMAKSVTINGEKVIVAVTRGWTQWGNAHFYLTSRDGVNFEYKARAWFISSQYGKSLAITDFKVMNDGRVRFSAVYNYYTTPVNVTIDRSLYEGIFTQGTSPISTLLGTTNNVNPVSF